MIIPSIGGIGGGLSGLVGEAASAGGPAAGAPAPGAVAGTEAPVAPLGGEAGSGPSTSFEGALTEAVSSLEQTQVKANGAANALATGTVKDPEAAVTTVEDAALAMQLAAQIRSKATEAAQTIFQTQV